MYSSFMLQPHNERIPKRSQRASHAAQTEPVPVVARQPLSRQALPQSPGPLPAPARQPFLPMSATEKGDYLPLPISSPIASRFPTRGKRRATWLRRVVNAIVSLALVYTLVSSGIVNSVRRSLPRQQGRTNVIFMVSDGYGPASATLGRSYMHYVHDLNKGLKAPSEYFMTPLDKILVGTHRSRSANSLVTDSAAGATAFACGLKTNNYAIGVDRRNVPCGTVLEGAKEQGMLTGVVVTTRITDATPGSYFAHVTSRGYEAAIANEVLGLKSNGSQYRSAPLDLAIGGGGCYFLPKGTPGSCRRDDIDLVGLAKEQGWNADVFFGEQHSQDLLPEKLELPYLGLLSPSNTPFVVDRPSSMPSLPVLSERALEGLRSSPKNTKGFFIMIEGSQIDLCGHENDPACQVREVAEYQETIARVMKWAEEAYHKHGEHTLIVSTSDHETGGLDLAMQQTEEPLYAYYPERLHRVRHSSHYLAAKLIDYAEKSSFVPDQRAIERYIREDVFGAQGTNFTPDNGGEASDHEVSKVFACLSADPDSAPYGLGQICQQEIAKCISKRANLGWSTHGHTGVDVNVYATGHGADAFRGNHENIELGQLIAKHLNIDLAAVTRRLLKQIG